MAVIYTTELLLIYAMGLLSKASKLPAQWLPFRCRVPAEVINQICCTSRWQKHASLSSLNAISISIFHEKKSRNFPIGMKVIDMFPARWIRLGIGKIWHQRLIHLVDDFKIASFNLRGFKYGINSVLVWIKMLTGWSSRHSSVRRHNRSPIRTPLVPGCRCVEEIGSVAILATKRMAGVAPEVCLRECVIHSDFET